MKRCSKCGLEKDLTQFYKNGQKYGLGYRSDCKTCHIPVVRRYQATYKGREVAITSDQKRTGTLVRKASHNQASVRYKQTDAGYLVNKAASHRRRERKVGLDSNFNKQDILEVYSRFGHKCFACGTDQSLSIDHHRALAHGYGLSINNAVILCISCNATKGTKSPEEFYTQEQLEVLHGLGII